MDAETGYDDADTNRHPWTGTHMHMHALGSGGRAAVGEQNIPRLMLARERESMSARMQDYGVSAPRMQVRWHINGERMAWLQLRRHIPALLGTGECEPREW